MLEWALLMVTGEEAEVVALKATQIECWQAASETEQKEGSQLACFELATVLESNKQKAAESR